MKNFDPKVYSGKRRIYQVIKGYRGISKLWIWNEFLKFYQIPERGNTYYARKTVLEDKVKRRETKSFPNLDGARTWLISSQLNSDVTQNSTPRSTATLADVIDKFREIRYRSLRKSTVDLYERQLRLYFDPLLGTSLSEFNSSTIDKWIGGLTKKQKSGEYKTTRTTFEQELRLLTTLLSFCREYFDDYQTLDPIKKRHRESVIIKKLQPKEKHLTEEQFYLFRDNLRRLHNGEMFSKLATVQYFQALRISEAAAIKWENIKFHLEVPRHSELEIKESIYWPRKKGIAAHVQLGFKNSEKQKDGKKVSTLLPESYKVLRAQFTRNSSGLVFALDGQVIEYRQIQYAYDQAFKKAGLDMRGTHIMRHGGASLAFNKSNGNLAVAAAQLGNTVSVAQTYSHLDKAALKNYANQIWDEDVAANGCVSEKLGSS